MSDHCNTCNCYAGCRGRTGSSAGFAPHKGGSRVIPRGGQAGNSCRMPGQRSWGCGCCKDWDHCISCNCYWEHAAAPTTVFSHISEADVDEGIRQEAEQKARKREEMGGMDEEDIVTPSPDEPIPSASSMSASQLSHGAAWRERGREAEDWIEQDIVAAGADELSQTLAELGRALALADQEDRHWEEHSGHLQEQVDQEATAMTQLENELMHSIKQPLGRLAWKRPRGVKVLKLQRQKLRRRLSSLLSRRKNAAPKGRPPRGRARGKMLSKARRKRGKARGERARNHGAKRSRKGPPLVVHS